MIRGGVRCIIEGEGLERGHRKCQCLGGHHDSGSGGSCGVELSVEKDVFRFRVIKKTHAAGIGFIGGRKRS